MDDIAAPRGMELGDMRLHLQSRDQEATMKVGSFRLLIHLRLPRSIALSACRKSTLTAVCSPRVYLRVKRHGTMSQLRFTSFMRDMKHTQLIEVGANIHSIYQIYPLAHPSCLGMQFCAKIKNLNIRVSSNAERTTLLLQKCYANENSKSGRNRSGQ